MRACNGGAEEGTYLAMLAESPRARDTDPPSWTYMLSAELADSPEAPSTTRKTEQGKSPRRVAASTREPNASQLLREAKRATKRGQPRRAYVLAARSHGKKRSTEALEVMTVSASRMHSKAKATAALKQLPRTKRRVARRQCRASGVRV